MSSPIAGISPAAIRTIEPLVTGGAQASGGGASAFSDLFEQAVDRVNHYQRTADGAVERFLTGEDEDLHRVAMATQQAEVSFELFLQMKNKVIQAYQEMMRLQV